MLSPMSAAMFINLVYAIITNVGTKSHADTQSLTSRSYKHMKAKPRVSTSSYLVFQAAISSGPRIPDSPDRSSFHQMTSTSPDTKMATTVRSTLPAQCRLLALPPELRNRIWRITLSRYEKKSMVQNPVIIATGEYWEEEVKHQQLLRVCRQIRTEALPIYYASSTFLFDVWCNDEVEHGGLWLRAIEDHVKHIRHVQLCAQLNTSLGYGYGVPVETLELAVDLDEAGQRAKVRILVNPYYAPTSDFDDLEYEDNRVAAGKLVEAAEKMLVRKEVPTERAVSSETWIQLLHLVLTFTKAYNAS